MEELSYYYGQEPRPRYTRILLKGAPVVINPDKYYRKGNYYAKNIILFKTITTADILEQI